MADGGFSLVVNQAGTYPLSAENFEKGYPNLGVGVVPFYGKVFRRVPDITVKENSSEPIKIVLGPRAGRLIVTLIDDATGKAIDRGSMTQCRLNEPKSCWSSMPPLPNGRYELLTPEVPFTINFATWNGKLVDGKWVNGKWVERKAFDGESGKPVEVLQVDLGARKEISVRLK